MGLSHWKQAIVLPKNAESPHMYVKPFLPPCIDGPFKNLYYWDTFFTNKGLLADGLIEEAKNNTENPVFILPVYSFIRILSPAPLRKRQNGRFLKNSLGFYPTNPKKYVISCPQCRKSAILTLCNTGKES